MKDARKLIRKRHIVNQHFPAAIALGARLRVTRRRVVFGADQQALAIDHGIFGVVVVEAALDRMGGTGCMRRHLEDVVGSTRVSHGLGDLS